MTSFTLKNPRILISNDDGIHADGLKILYKVAQSLSNDVWVVAPETEKSGAGHALSLHRPLTYRLWGEKRYSVNGTPTDCIVLALKEIIKDKRPDLVLSGVNHGSNLAEDVTYSGTIAAAMEATLLRIPAIAFSLATKEGQPPMWDTAFKIAPSIIAQLAHFHWHHNVFISVNFPNCSHEQVKDIRVTFQGQRILSDQLLACHDPRGKKHYWIGATGYQIPEQQRGSDLEVLTQNAVSVTPLHVNLTHTPSINELKKQFGPFGKTS